MKKMFKIFTISFCAILFLGCSKNPEVPLSKEEQIAKWLTGDFNKVWHLTKVYQNNVPQVLTDAQLKYTKTYTITPGESKRGVFTNSDGYNGSWKVMGEFEMKEEFTNNPRGPLPIAYDINNITEKILDVQYTANFVTTREVYYAF